MKDKKETLTTRIVLLSIAGIIIALPLLYINCFFCNFSSTVFNEVLSPIVLLFTFIIIYFQLRDTQSANETQISNQEYNSYLNELMERGRRLEKLKFKVDESMNRNEFYSDLVKKIEASNGISYIPAYSAFCIMKKTPADNDGDKEINKDMFLIFIFYFLYPLQREYEALLDFFKEVNENQLMSERQKKRIFKKAEMDFLQEYFEICNHGEYDGSTKLSDLNNRWKKEFGELLYYKVENFYKINYFYKSLKLFQYRTLEHYQKPEQNK